MNNKIKIISTTHEVDNSGDANRAVAISGTIVEKDGAITEVQRGTVSSLEGGRRIATFNRSSGSNLSVRFNGWDGHSYSEALAEVEGFIDDCMDAEAE